MPRWLSFLIFFSVFLAVWGSANTYIFRRGWQALRSHPRLRRLKRWYVALALFLASGYVLYRTVDNLDFAGKGWVLAPLAWIGSIWLGFAPYFLLACLAIDLARLGNRAFGYFPASWAEEQKRARVRMTTAAAVVTVVTLANLVGYLNALRTGVRTVEIAVNKPFEPARLRIAMASDIHLGTVVGPARLAPIVAALNAQQADLVLLPGDVVDEHLRPGTHPEICRLLDSIEARLGVYGSTGNHEFIVGADKSVPFLEACGVAMLRDRVIETRDGFYLAGREDRSRDRMDDSGAGKRAPLSEILAGVDRSLPVILMDHTPIDLDAARRQKVDLQVSGHTHNAQLWPFQLITALVYEQDWGYLRKGDTHYYVSCGAGIWGPPVRTNSVSEVIVIDVAFEDKTSSTTPAPSSTLDLENLALFVLSRERKKTSQWLE